jgi:hypothetical protein
MPTQNPKKVAEKLQSVIDAWTTLRPTKSFAGMTLEQFKAKVQPSLDTRSSLTTLRSQATDHLTQRQLSDDASIGLAQLVVNSVKGDVEEGENGSLYAAMGYVTKNARQSGLTRKGQTTPPATQTATANAAAPTVTTK